MRIAIYYNEYFSTGGIEKQIAKLSKKLKDIGHDVTVIFKSEKSDINRLLDISKNATVVNYNYQKDRHYDIAIYEGIHNLEDVSADKKILVLNGNLVDAKEKYDVNIDFDLYIAVSDDCAEQFNKVTGKTAIVIPNLIDIEENIELSKEPIDIEKGDIIFVTVSRIDNIKGFDNMEIMIKELEARKINYKWYIVGNGFLYNSLENSLKKSWEKYKDVIFVGEKFNPMPYIANADYLVQLSKFESQCISMFDALTLSVPVIVTNWKTATEVVNDTNGIIFKNDMSDFDIDKILNSKFKFEKYEYPDYFELWKEQLKPIKKKNNKFTVLIPNYNNGKYLEKCLNSVLNQTYKNYEIIFVDDMSDDNSLEIANKLLKKHKVIELKQKRYNGGTRNVGILESNSDYTICIDSDDWLIDNNVIERINNALQRNEDILFLEYNMYKNGKEVILNPLKQFKDKLEAIKAETCAIWTKVVKTSLLKDTLFDEGNLMEDKIHHMRLCYKMNKWKILNGATHIWNRDNIKSVSTAKNYKWDNCAYRHIAEYLDFYNEVNDEQVKTFINERIELMHNKIKQGVYKQL